MTNFDTGVGGCSIHGPITICGHTDATCSDKMKVDRADEKPSAIEIATNTIVANLETGGFYPEFQGPEAEKRKQRLIEIAEQLPTLAPAVLTKFRELLEQEKIDGGKLSFFIVGGRVNATPIKDNTDFDIVLASEKRALAGGKIWRKRTGIWETLYQEIERLLGQLYEEGLIEIKGLGQRSAEDVEGEEGTLKIAELE
ncbi:MAG: hypothetical protein Q7K16_02385 [Candidatus Azambacteria bacterium]|nr:hypothetical protein [Candidatus Azambacteria bacterium]